MENRSATVIPLRRARRRALFICGSEQQAALLHAVARELPSWDARFTPSYADSPLDLVGRLGLLDGSIVGRQRRKRSMEYLRDHALPLDLEGRGGRYDLVVTCADLVVPRNVSGNRLVLVQDEVSDHEGLAYELVRRFEFLPRWLAGTAALGLSLAYDRFCVASEGYREFFARKGVPSDRMVVTGAPHFDNLRGQAASPVPHRSYVLACPSEQRQGRAAFLRRCARLARGRTLVVKPTPHEDLARAAGDLARHAPGARLDHTTSTEALVAHSEVVITQRASVALVGLALGKEVHSHLEPPTLRRLMPSPHVHAAHNIAGVCRDVVGELPPARPHRTDLRGPS